MTRIISYSEVFAKQTCDRQYYYRHILGLKYRADSAAMDTGTKGHLLMQLAYECMKLDMPLAEIFDRIDIEAKQIMEKMSEPDFNLLTAWTMVKKYIEEGEFKSTPKFIENRFLLPVHKLTDDPYFEDVVIGFTPDVVFERKGNFLDVEDSKFVQRGWTKKKIQRFPQSRLYQIFLEAMGYKVSRSSIRFFNVKNANIYEHSYTMDTKTKKILLRDFLKGIKEALEYKTLDEVTLAESPRTMNYTICAGCYFAGPCNLESEGKDATATFLVEYEKSNYDYTR